MPASGDELTQDLKQLRNRRGLRAIGTGARVEIGTALQTICRVNASDTAGEKQRKVSGWIEELLPQLAADHRWALSVAFGIAEEADHDTYQDRVRWAAGLDGRSPRTFERRVDRAIAELVAVLGARVPEPAVESGPSVAPWRTKALRLLLLLECEVPEVIEIRQIVSQIKGLNEVDLAISVPPDGQSKRLSGDLDLVVFNGGTVIDHRMVSSDRHGVFVQLARPLAKGESHEIVLRYRAHMRQPHAACVPRYPCDLFDLSVRFGQRQPTSIHRLDGVLHGDARDSGQRGPEVELNASGEVRTVFEHLKPGFAYGLKWVGGPGG